MPIKERPDKNIMILADRFRSAREHLGLTTREMAAKLGIHPRSWNDYENGESMPGGNVFRELAKLGFNANWLLIGEGEMKKK